MPVVPEQYAATSSYELLCAAGRAHAAIDHRFLHAILDEPDRSLPGLLRFALEDRFDDRIPLEEVLILIFRHLPAPGALPFLIDCARRRSFDIPEDLVEALRAQGTMALEPLLELHREVSPEQPTDIPFLLACLRIRDERVQQLLEEIQRADPDEGDFYLEIYNAASETPDPFHIWGEFPETDQPPWSILPETERLDFLACPSPEYRAGAAASLAGETLSPECARRLFELARTDPEPQVRASCWESLAGERAPAGIPSAMYERLGDDATPLVERAGLVVAMASEAADPLVRRSILALYEASEFRHKALEAMWRSLDRSFAAYFPRHFEDPDLSVRRHAIQGAGYLGMGGEVDRLRRLFNDEDVRGNALCAYALACPGEVSPARMRRLVGKIDELAGGLSPEEAAMVRAALDDRLMLHGYRTIFFPEPQQEELVARTKTGRNDPCPCGSGKKYKKCCGT